LSPLAIAAAPEASDALLLFILVQHIDTASQPILSQRERCLKAFSPSKALEQTLAFFDERQPSIRLNAAKCKLLALEDIRANGLRMLGT
jgi:hypothetical protein